MGIVQKIRNLSKLEEMNDADYSDDVEYALHNDLSIVFSRLPDSDDIHLIIGEKVVEIDYSKIEEMDSGFVMQPFETSKKLNLISVKKQSYVEENVLQKLSEKELPFHFGKTQEILPIQGKEHYIDYVTKAIDIIKSEDYKKIVCARSEIIQSKINPLNAFLKLCQTYPNAFVSLVSTKEFGTWVGASPELLLEEKDGRIHTVALAGTQLHTDEITEKSAAWTSKEIEEQALVSRYIINRFKSIRLREFEDVGPRTIRAGNLLHLKTDFYISKKEVDVDNLGSELAKLLHPTSAVCGMPQEVSESFILRNEKMNRQLYSGFIGFIDNENLHLFVNLRCMKVEEDNYTLFAGAGITQESDPEKEWLETSYKMDTLKKVLY